MVPDAGLAMLVAGIVTEMELEETVGVANDAGWFGSVHASVDPVLKLAPLMVRVNCGLPATTDGVLSDVICGAGSMVNCTEFDDVPMLGRILPWIWTVTVPAAATNASPGRKTKAELVVPGACNT